MATVHHTESVTSTAPVNRRFVRLDVYGEWQIYRAPSTRAGSEGHRNPSPGAPATCLHIALNRWVVYCNERLPTVQTTGSRLTERLDLGEILVTCWPAAATKLGSPDLQQWCINKLRDSMNRK